MACFQSILNNLCTCTGIDGDRGTSDFSVGNRDKTRNIRQATGRRFQRQTSFIGRASSHCSKDCNSPETKVVERSRRSSTETGDAQHSKLVHKTAESKTVCFIIKFYYCLIRNSYIIITLSLLCRKNIRAAKTAAKSVKTKTKSVTKPAAKTVDKESVSVQLDANNNGKANTQRFVNFILLL